MPTWKNPSPTSVDGRMEGTRGQLNAMSTTQRKVKEALGFCRWLSQNDPKKRREILAELAGIPVAEQVKICAKMARQQEGAK